MWPFYLNGHPITIYQLCLVHTSNGSPTNGVGVYPSEDIFQADQTFFILGKKAAGLGSIDEFDQLTFCIIKAEGLDIVMQLFEFLAEDIGQYVAP